MVRRCDETVVATTDGMAPAIAAAGSPTAKDDCLSITLMAASSCTAVQSKFSIVTKPIGIPARRRSAWTNWQLHWNRPDWIQSPYANRLDQPPFVRLDHSLTLDWIQSDWITGWNQITRSSQGCRLVQSCANFRRWAAPCRAEVRLFGRSVDAPFWLLRSR